MFIGLKVNKKETLAKKRAFIERKFVKSKLKKTRSSCGGLKQAQPAQVKGKACGVIRLIKL